MTKIAYMSDTRKTIAQMEAIKSTFKDLPKDDSFRKLVTEFVKSAKTANQFASITENGALETLGAIGIMLAKNGGMRQ